MTQGWTIPDYNIRESKRARRMTIKVSSWTGLEVVVPVGFNQKHIAEFVQSKSRWIKKALENTHPVEELKRPESVELGLQNDTWSVEYSPSPDQRSPLGAARFRQAGPELEPRLENSLFLLAAFAAEPDRP